MFSSVSISVFMCLEHLFGEAAYARYPTGYAMSTLLEAEQQVPWRTEEAWNTKAEHVQTHTGW